MAGAGEGVWFISICCICREKMKLGKCPDVAAEEEILEAEIVPWGGNLHFRILFLSHQQGFLQAATGVE